MSDEADCRTAPATPGLLNRVLSCPPSEMAKSRTCHPLKCQNPRIATPKLTKVVDSAILWGVGGGSFGLCNFRGWPDQTLATVPVCMKNQAILVLLVSNDIVRVRPFVFGFCHLTMWEFSLCFLICIISCLICVIWQCESLAFLVECVLSYN